MPELYADEKYDFWVGQAELITQPKDYFWDIVLTSHSLVDSVIGIERALRSEFPIDRQLCNEYRNNVFVKTQCEDFAAAYHDRMGGMVESRMQASIVAVVDGIDAGEDVAGADRGPGRDAGAPARRVAAVEVADASLEPALGFEARRAGSGECEPQRGTARALGSG